MAQRNLNADLDIIRNSNLEISLLEGDLNIIQKLDDEPNDVGGLTAQELKATFDRAGNIIKEYINETLVPEVLSEGITENQRRSNESVRQAAEADRVSAEAGRASAEAARENAESARASAEGTRQAAETARETAETAREAAESAKARAETGREAAEGERTTAETGRRAAETGRASAEGGRASAETAREAAETARETAEEARARAETARETAEAERRSAQAAFFTGVAATAQTLAPGSAATAAAVAEGGSFRLELGIPRGEKGDTGAGLEVLGLYGTAADLRAAHPAGAPGEAFAVGTEEDNVLYVWSGDAGDWVSVGPLRGRTGADGGTGKSAYELAAENGYAGTVEEWLAGLKGEDASLPSGGTVGQVLTKTGSGEAWRDAPSGRQVWTTEETVIGTWFDGRPRYRKLSALQKITFSKTTLATPCWSQHFCDFNVENIDKETAAISIASSNHGNRFPSTYNISNTNFGVFCLSINPVIENYSSIADTVQMGISVYVIGDNSNVKATLSISNVYGILEYCKTTDTPAG